MSESPEAFKNYTRRCLTIFSAIVVGTLLMVAAGTPSIVPMSSHSLRIALVLAIASCNAGVVATFLMHLISERKFIHITLLFTVIFFVALMFLSIYAQHDVPHLLAH